MTEAGIEPSLWILGELATENVQSIAPAYMYAELLAGVLVWTTLPDASLIGWMLEIAWQYLLEV